MTDFKERLRIRFSKHHSTCSICLRHKLLLKRLGHCGPARRAQLQLLQQHRTRQRRDRQCYWMMRASSRLDAQAASPSTICCILDSMDAAKHSWPRSQIMKSKEFSAFNRPRLTSTTLLVHGHLALLGLSPHFVSSNSSRSCELLSHALTLLSEKVRLEGACLHIQGDNCCRELKNNSVLRLLAMWVAVGKVARAQMACLTSGHSHEDIDALFSLLRAHLQDHQELWTPLDFQRCLERWFASEDHRPHEPMRRVCMISRFRDWNLDRIGRDLRQTSYTCV